MPRTKIVTRKQAQIQELERKEKLDLAQIKMNTTLEKIDELAIKYQHEVSHQIKFLRDNTDRKLLQMKWSDFMGLNLKHFPDQKKTVSGPPVSQSLPVDQQQARTQLQSLDLSFLRWPRAGEVVFSKAGSPLAVLRQPERCANANIPTSKGVISVKPQKMKHMDSDALKNMDQKTINQVKALNTNLEIIVDMATKMEKLKMNQNKRKH
ncbi:hypothetical protein KR054_010981 [Drosophila jambulina]|nr:hypothetical protein KR054_010981 [Drosophila jambulina]